MCKRLIYVMTFVLVLGSTAHAALYLWNGSAGDGNWDTALNWTVTDSAWTWPNEEFGNKMVNSDTIGIDILNGDAVTREGELAIQGAADGSTTAVLTVNGSSLTTTGDLETNDGEGHIIISGNATVNLGDDLELANEPNGVGTVDISGTATVTLGDDIDVGKKGVGTLNISGDATLHVPDELYIGDDAGSEGHMTMSGNATVTIVDDLDVGDDGFGTFDISENATISVDDDINVGSEVDSEGHMTISGNSTVSTADELYIGKELGATGNLDVSGTATLNVADDIEVGDAHIGTCNIGENATVNVDDDIIVGTDAGSEGHLTISGNASVTCDDMLVGGSLESITSLTINGGKTIIRDDLIMGSGDGDPSVGQSRIFMNGGLLQAEGLDIKITDSQVIYTGGLFGIGSASLDVAGMQQLITDGTIVVDVADAVYSIATTGDGYTVLNPWLPPMPKVPNPADGAEGVLLGVTLSWGAGDTAATHDVYFGTSSPPALIGNQEATTYHPGPIELGTTYYWQIVEIEADGTTKHTGDVWSFTTTTDLSTVSEIATQPKPADGTDGVLIEGITLSWWAGASAVSHDVHFGNTSPPALIGNQAEMSYDTGGLKPSTTYYWQVNAVEADGTTVHAGDIWSFTTESGIATEPDPADGATDIPKMATLSWMPGLTAASHDVYFSADQQAVIDGTAPVTNVTETSFSTEMLDKGKTYYWRVDAVEADGTTKYTGDVWSFTVTTAGR